MKDQDQERSPGCTGSLTPGGCGAVNMSSFIVDNSYRKGGQPALIPLPLSAHYTVAPHAHGHPEVHPVFSPETAKHLNTAFAELNCLGIIPRIDSAFRTPTEQAFMQSGGSGSNPAARISWHEAGAAVDINGTRMPQFKTIISIMKSNGFIWGGDFRTEKDYPHFDGRDFSGNLNQAVMQAQTYWDSIH